MLKVQKAVSKMWFRGITVKTVQDQVQLKADVCVCVRQTLIDVIIDLFRASHFLFTLTLELATHNFNRCLWISGKGLPVERTGWSVCLPLLFHLRFLPSFHAEMGHFLPHNIGPDEHSLPWNLILILCFLTAYLPLTVNLKSYVLSSKMFPFVFDLWGSCWSVKILQKKKKKHFLYYLSLL